jgi:polyhydroxybutyrate depolymerase
MLGRRLAQGNPTMAAWVIGLVLVGAGVFGVGGTAVACGPDTDCIVAGGTYRVRPPAGWDGRSPLPAAVFFHGWQDSAAGVMADARLGQALSDKGVLLAAPNGIKGDWAFPGLPPVPGMPVPRRDDVAFVDAVLADLQDRFPIDRARLWATGFSIGGSMVWYEACERGHAFAAFAPIAGAFWKPMPTRCPSGPVNLSHIHGLTDAMVPLEGREPEPGFVQGDVFAAMALLRETDGCSSAPTRFGNDGPLVCRIWDGCTSGRVLRMCLHPYEHDMRPPWILDAWEWVQSLPR